MSIKPGYNLIVLFLSLYAQITLSRVNLFYLLLVPDY